MEVGRKDECRQTRQLQLAARRVRASSTLDVSRRPRLSGISFQESPTHILVLFFDARASWHHCITASWASRPYQKASDFWHGEPTRLVNARLERRPGFSRTKLHEFLPSLGLHKSPFGSSGIARPPSPVVGGSLRIPRPGTRSNYIWLSLFTHS